jgi:hypothetical protein
MMATEKTRHPCRRGGKSDPGRYLDVARQHSGPLSIRARRGLKMFDLAQKRLPGLSGGAGLRGPACVASCGPRRRAGSPAAFWRAP